MSEEFDFDTPEQLRPWLESQEIKKEKAFQKWLDNRHFIFVNGKIKSVSLLEWDRWFGVFENRVIDRTDISNEPNYPGGDFISTVFIGLDSQFEIDEILDGTHKPFLFETMVFGGKYNERGWKYASYLEAKKGHWEIVDCIRRGEAPQVSFGERPWIEYFFEMFRDNEED